MAQVCKNCNVTVVGSHYSCPLCQGLLAGSPSPQEDSFPKLHTIMERHNLLIRTLFFISSVLVVLSFAANYLLSYQGFWSLLVAIGVVCMWISLSIVFRKRHNVPKTIVWQAVLWSLVTVAMDLLTGWHRWSISYAVPIFFIVAILGMWAIVAILHLRLEDFLVYMLIDLLLGIIPLAFILLDWVSVSLPSVLCVLASTISLIAIIAFKDKALRVEFKKRLHI